MLGKNIGRMQSEYNFILKCGCTGSQGTEIVVIPHCEQVLQHLTFEFHTFTEFYSGFWPNLSPKQYSRIALIAQACRYVLCYCNYNQLLDYN